MQNKGQRRGCRRRGIRVVMKKKNSRRTSYKKYLRTKKKTRRIQKLEVRLPDSLEEKELNLQIQMIRNERWTKALLITMLMGRT